ncbi:MAG: hypothetical protein LBI67_05915 [Treponema sp.]|jgi:hypothetical protein|nr:hypothetical protein [Treponema sp.]
MDARPRALRQAAFLLLSAILPYHPAAQEQSWNPGKEGSYFMDDSGENPRFIQRLSWYPEQYALFYELIIEELSGETYREIFRTTTAEDHADISLPPGLYRYRIQSYDLFEKPSGNPSWARLEILPALRPELFGVEKDALYKQNGTLAVTGRNIAEGALAVLRNRKTGSEETGVLHTEADGGSGRAVFSSFPKKGIYDLTVINPGGLRDSFGPVSLSPSPENVYFSAGYKPMIPLFGQLNEMLDSKIHPLGFSVRFWTVPFEWKTLGIGFQAEAGYNFLFSDYSQSGFDYRVTGHFADLALHVVVEKRFSQKLSLALHAGPALAASVDFKKTNALFRTKAVNAVFPGAGAGISALYFFSNRWFAMTGLECLYIFSRDETNPAYLSPYIGIGSKL